MFFHIEAARPEDASAIAHLHIQAFTSNALMRAIYPTSEIWEGLEKATKEKLTADMEHPKLTVLVARYKQEASEDVVGYAVWAHPIHTDEPHTPLPSWKLPEGTNWEVLGPWKEAAAQVAEAVIGDRPHYELSWLVVSPSYARRGIGKKLLRRGLDLCDQHGLPAYVESTVEAAETFYEKAGFVEKERIILDLCVKGKSGEMYEEVACLYEPQHS